MKYRLLYILVGGVPGESDEIDCCTGGMGYQENYEIECCIYW